MLTHTLLTITSILLFVHMSHASSNTSDLNFLPAVATFYHTLNGSISGSGDECGFSEQELASAPYYGFTATGNLNLFKYGKGCGNCYQVKCTENPECSRVPITITISDECLFCRGEAVQFELSDKAGGYLAKPGQANALLETGVINVQYQRVPCHYKANINFKVQAIPDRYIGFVILNVNGDGELSKVEILPSNSKQWKPMQNTFGIVWKFNITDKTKGPYSVRLTGAKSKKSII